MLISTCDYRHPQDKETSSISSVEGELGVVFIGSMLKVVCIPPILYPEPHRDMCEGPYGANGYGYPGKPIVGGIGGAAELPKAVSNNAGLGLAAFDLAFTGISPIFSSLGELVVEFHPFTYSLWNLR